MKITAETSNKDFKRLTKLREEIRAIRIFPRYLGVGVSVTFLLFIFSAFADSAWLVQTANRVPDNDFFIGLLFYLSIAGFFAIGSLAISEIFNTMRKEFEDVKRKKKEAEEYKVGDSVLRDIGEKLYDKTRGT